MKPALKADDVAAVVPGSPVTLVDANGQPINAQPDPQALRIAELEKEVSELKALCARQKAKIGEAEVDMLVSLAIDEGKLLPVMRQWASTIGRSNFALLQAFISNSPVLPTAASGGES